jgi:hypothetical protein
MGRYEIPLKKTLLFISVHVINTVKEIQLMHNAIVYFKPLFLVPKHVSANNNYIIREYYY